MLIKVSYFAPLLGSNKERANNTQKLINKGLRWISGLHKAKSFITVNTISKDSNISSIVSKVCFVSSQMF